MSHSLVSGIVGGIVGALLFAGLSVYAAWSGPTAAPPGDNASAPINVGSEDQVKNAGLSLNALALFGNALLSGTSRYINFGTSAGSAGYGIRDNNGVMEYRNAGGAWLPIASTTANGANTNFIVSSDVSNVDLYVLAGSPTVARTYTITVNTGVTVGSASTGAAALTSGTWPAGSTVILINRGNIYGRAGVGGTPGCGYTTSTRNGGAGGAGGLAMSLSNNITIDNSNGTIAGGGGGGGGSGSPVPPGSTATTCAGSGGNGQGSQSPSGPTGSTGGAGGGSGGVFATAGNTGAFYNGVGGAGGAGGAAINLNGRTITWLGGNNATQVKGAVQ